MQFIKGGVKGPAIPAIIQPKRVSNSREANIERCTAWQVAAEKESSWRTSVWNLCDKNNFIRVGDVCWVIDGHFQRRTASWDSPTHIAVPQ